MRKLMGICVLILVLGCALAAGDAGAASRGFKLTNDSKSELTLLAVQHILGPCSGCIPLPYDMEFEGRPKDKSSLKTGETADWELKHAFTLSSNPNYAAELIYKIAGGATNTEETVVWKIYTYNFSNESTCHLYGADEALLAKLECKAEGLKLEFLDKGAKVQEAGAEPRTVAQFHKLPKAERRAFALEFLTTEPVDPCDGGKTPLGEKAAQEVVGKVIAEVRPSLVDSEGRTIGGDAPVGLGIRAVLGNAGCRSTPATI
jgi:hypothetical protein